MMKKKENGIDYYIEIEADESTLKYLKNNFNKTILKNIFILTDKEWKQIGIKMNKSLLIEICNYYNNNPGIKVGQLAELFGIHHVTTSRYLIKGQELGLCIYSKGSTRGKNILAINLENKKEYIFSSISNCVKGLNYYYKDLHFCRKSIIRVLYKEKEIYNNFSFEFLNKIDDTYKENCYE